MARPQIIEKVSREMHFLPIRHERQIMYLLAEIRKAVEQCSDQERGAFPNLKFFCNWALHAKLDQESSRKRIAELCSVFDMYDIHAQRLVLSRFHNEMIMLLPFREALARFLTMFSVETRITEDEAEWCRFVYHYSGIISDVPLVRTGQVPATEVREVIVSRMPNDLPYWPEYIRWDLRLGDGSPRYAYTQISRTFHFCWTRVSLVGEIGS